MRCFKKQKTKNKDKPESWLESPTCWGWWSNPSRHPTAAPSTSRTYMPASTRIPPKRQFPQVRVGDRWKVARVWLVTWRPPAPEAFPPVSVLLFFGGEEGGCFFRFRFWAYDFWFLVLGLLRRCLGCRLVFYSLVLFFVLFFLRQRPRKSSPKTPSVFCWFFTFDLPGTFFFFPASVIRRRAPKRHDPCLLEEAIVGGTFNATTLRIVFCFLGVDVWHFVFSFLLCVFRFWCSGFRFPS